MYNELPGTLARIPVTPYPVVDYFDSELLGSRATTNPVQVPKTVEWHPICWYPIRSLVSPS
jgi:hypothetical protein